jgi:site-specific recombinase XerD
MTLHELTAQYVGFKRAAGTDFTSAAQLLSALCRVVGGGAAIGAIRDEHLRAFLAGRGPLTRYWHRKHSVLLGFYRYAVSRGYLAALPSVLAARPPKAPPACAPYLYTREEIRRLLDATARYQKQRCHLSPHTFRTLLLMLYGAGLRISEALQLTLADVDLAAAVITIRDTKFYKTRLVPLGPDLQQVVQAYAAERRTPRWPQGPAAAFFVDRTGAPLLAGTVRRAFGRLRACAGVARTDGARYPPRLHDFRHTFTVHRLTAWYREGADVQQWLPRLATYLGHLNLAATQVYLTTTPELLHEAARRFEHYARKEGYDE